MTRPGADAGARLWELFVAPSDAPRNASHTFVRRPPSLAVLGSPREAPAVGAAVALRLARVHRSPCVLLCTWTGAPAEPAGWAAPAPRAARRLASRLLERDHDARAAGRLVRVALPADEGRAGADAARVMAAAGEAPAVLVVGGPRGSELESLVREQDHVMVLVAPDAPAGLGEIAVTGLALAAGRASTYEVAPCSVGRALALAGVAVGPGLRSTVAVAVRAVA